METKAKINKWDLIKFKSFCATKETKSKVKRQTSEWEKITASEATDKGVVKSLSCVWLFATPWTVAHHAPHSVGFSRHEYWSGLPFLSPECLPTQGLNPGLPHCRQTLYHLNHQGSNWQRIKLKNIQAAHEAQFQKNKWPNQKMSQRTKQTFLQKGHTDS